MDQLVKNLGNDPWQFHDTNRFVLSARKYYFDEGMFWVTEKEATDLIMGDKPLIPLKTSGVGGNIRQSIRNYNSRAAASLLPAPRSASAMPSVQVKDYCSCNGRSSDTNTCTRCACTRAGRKCNDKCRCGDKCAQVATDAKKKKQLQATEDVFCVCAKTHHGARRCINCVCVQAGKSCSYKCKCPDDDCNNHRHRQAPPSADGPCDCFRTRSSAAGRHGSCTACRCVIRGEACTRKCGCKGTCKYMQRMPPEGPELPMEVEGPLLPMEVEQEKSAPEVRSPPLPPIEVKSPPRPPLESPLAAAAAPEVKSPPPPEVKSPPTPELMPPPLEVLPDAIPMTYQPCECKGGKCDPITCRCKIDQLICTSACDCKGNCSKPGRKKSPAGGCGCKLTTEGGARCDSCSCRKEKKVCDETCGCQGGALCRNATIKQAKKRKAEQPLKSILKKKVRFTLDLTGKPDGLDMLAAASSAASASSTSPPTPMDTTPAPAAAVPPPRAIPPQASLARTSGGLHLPLQRPAAPASQFAASFASGAVASVVQPPVRMDTQPDQLTRVATQIRIAQAAQDIFKSLRAPTQADIEARDAMSSMALQQMVEEMRKK